MSLGYTREASLIWTSRQLTGANGEKTSQNVKLVKVNVEGGTTSFRCTVLDPPQYGVLIEIPSRRH